MQLRFVILDHGDDHTSLLSFVLMLVVSVGTTNKLNFDAKASLQNLS